ncbi:MAG: DUF547 domain-containing protein [Bacteroidia bacterium]
MRKSILVSILSILFLQCNSANFEGNGKAPSHEIWNNLLKKNVSADGKVNYKGFIKDSVELNKYLKLLTDNPPNEKTWSANEQKAFWINAYNAFTVKLIIKYYPIKSIKDIGSKIQIPFVNTPWDVKFIFIGKEKMDLNNIEHGQLRKKFNDPRIHFAIVCASKSCPALLNEAFDPARLDQQLDNQAKVFLKDSFRNKVSATNPQLSKLFDWYKMDFTKKESLIEFLNKYSSVKINANAKITYLDYDWNLNE